MEFYISPDQRQNLEHKLNLMFKHLEHKPEVKISNTESVVKETIYNYGVEGYSRQRTKIFACHVEIEDIRTSDWVLVATVDYKLGSLLMGDARLFKNIPEQYGLKYTKCDHCGSEHKNRSESHILYNTVTDTWMQVGSTCINKMIDGGKYLNGLIVKLYNVIDMFGGCGDEEWAAGGWRPSNKYMVSAVSFEDALTVCASFMKNVSDVWKKAERDEWSGRKIGEGTNDALMRYFGELTNPNNPDNNFEADHNLYETLKKYFDNIEYGEVNYEKSLTQKIKDAFENEYIELMEMFLAWFAITNYRNSLTAKDFESQIKEFGIERGAEYNFYGKLEAVNTVEKYDWRGEETYALEYVFTDEKTGLRFSKEVSSTNAVEKYKQEDGNYKFTGTIKYIAYRKQMIGFGGRLKKTKN